MTAKIWTLAEIHRDLQDYLSGECVDPVGYLETLETRLQAAITRLDSAEVVPGRRGEREDLTMDGQDRTEGTFDEWAIVELLGHRRLAGRVREVQIAGAGFLRLDIPECGGYAAQTQFVAPGSVYALHPTTQTIATAAAANFRPQPVSRWELERAEGFDPDEIEAAFDEMS